MPNFYGVNDSTSITLAASGVASTIYSLDQSTIYSVRRDGMIDRFDTATGTLLGSWNVGVGLAGASLSDDGSFLMVTRADHAATAYRITTATGAVQSFTGTGSFYDIEIVDANTAIVTGSQAQSLNLNTGVFSPLTGGGYYAGGYAMMTEDTHLTLLASPGSSNGPLAIFDDRTGTITASGDNYQSGAVSGFNYGMQAISEAAGQVAQFAYYGVLNIYNLSLQIQRWVNVGQRVDGLTYSADGKFLYAYLIDTGVIAKYATSDFTLVDQYAVGTSQWHNNYGYGEQLHVSADGSYITVNDASSTGALRLVHLTGRNESFAGTAGADNFCGFDGDDTYLVNHVGDLVFEDIGKGIDTVQSSISYSLGANVENLTLTGSAALTGTGNALANTLIGNAAASTLNGNSGNDRLFVGSGGTGTNVDGGADSDTLVVTGSVSPGALANLEAIEFQNGATLTLTAAQFTTGILASGMLSGSGTLTINMGPADLELYLQQLTIGVGSNLAINIKGSASGEIIKGALQTVNTINGRGGDDQIRGGALADTINGGDGDDKIIGANGADLLTGGTGADTFRYLAASHSGVGAAADTITDFTIGTDKLAFALIDTDPVTPGDQAFAFIGNAAFGATGAAEMRYMNSGANLLIQADINGDGIADMEVVLAGLAGQALTGASFLL